MDTSDTGYDMEGDFILIHPHAFIREVQVRKYGGGTDQKVTRTPTATCQRSYSRSPSLKA